MTFIPLRPVIEATALAQYSQIFFIIIIFAAFYFFILRPQKKKEKETKDLRSSVQVGDEITSIGGIVGRVVSIKDEEIVIETSADKSKIKLMKWAIQQKNKIEDEKAK